MTEGSGRQRSGVSREAGAPRLALPSDLAGSLRRLDDGQLGRLLRAASQEARRRGCPQEEVPGPSPAPAAAEARRAPPATRRSKKGPVSMTPGQEKLVRAAFAAGVKPAAIARQLRLSRAQIERIVGRPKRGGG